MTATQKNLIAGSCLILGGIYMMIWGAAHILPAVLITIGVFGLHARQSPQAGTFGNISLILLIVCLAIVGGLDLYKFLFLHVAEPLRPIVFGLLGFTLEIGMFIYGIATMRAKVFQGWGLLVIGSLLTFIMGSWGAKLAFFGFVVLGYYLLRSSLPRKTESNVPNLQ